MQRILVSGCFDILHGGHVTFLKDAAAQGDHLTVCVATDETIRRCKGREPAMPQEHRLAVIRALTTVDATYYGSDEWEEAHANYLTPMIDYIDTLVVTEDDVNVENKRKMGILFDYNVRVIPKRLEIDPISTTEIRERVCQQSP